MKPLPEGVLTLFFSDVEGSTQMAQQHGDAAWATLLETHRALLREAFTRHNGLEVDTQGDAFFAVFRMPSDAAAAALAAQQALAAQAWPAGAAVRVRIGLHTGEAIVRGQHYMGQEVHRASRICDAGHGGQIVVSPTTADLLRARLPEGATLLDLGEHRLKGLDHAQRLYQLSPAGSAQVFKPLRSLGAPHNLPAPRTSFIGREKEIAAIRGWLAQQKLVTLTGIGGAGKTRLALQVGALELARYPDGVHFVDLAPVGDAQLVVPTVVSACGLLLGDAPGEGTLPLQESLVKALARRKALLIVDNCEHLLEAVATLLDRLSSACPELGLLATSREALGIDGEQTLPVPSLAVAAQADAAEGNEAMRLFVERARSVRPGFALEAANAAAVADICRRLDGIPLAIEFAAARVAYLSVQQIAERLEDRFRLLTGGRSRIQRQQTLAAALDWSHDLLDDAERAVFRRMSLFAGSFALEAVEAICADEAIAAPEVVALLGSLVAKSLVTTVADDRGLTRYRLLETVRLYAADKLLAAGEAAQLRARHRDWYIGWVEGMEPTRLAYADTTLADVARELDNLRAAADACQADGQPRPLARLATRLWMFWWTGNSAREGCRWLLEALRHGEQLPVEERVACHAVLGLLYTTVLDPPRSIAHSAKAIGMAEGQPSLYLMCAMSVRAFNHSILAPLPGADPQLATEARREAAAARALVPAVLGHQWQGLAELASAWVETSLGDYKAAALWWSEMADAADRDAEPGWRLPVALAGLAAARHLMGQRDEALRPALRLLALPGLDDSPLAMVRTLAVEVTPALMAAGHEAEALRVLRHAASDVERIGLLAAGNQVLTMVAVAEHLRGRHDRAARLLAASRNVQGAANPATAFRSPNSAALFYHYLPRVRAALGADDARRARDDGQAMTLDEALAYAVGGLG